MARPERVFTDDEVELVEKLAASLTHEQLAKYFCICDNTLREIMKRDTRVSEAYDRGLTRAGVMMVEKLYDKAMEGDHPSMKLWLSQRMGWTEKSRTEHTGADGKPIQMDVDTHWTIEVME
jgi:hypothetical protein